MLTIYVHIPYCLVKCGYCDFHSLPTSRAEIPQQNYAQAISAQLEHALNHYQLRGRELGAIFFGGGTPSLMEASFFSDVLSSLQQSFVFANDIEITTEMNPATAKLPWLKQVRACGVNRLSIGIQSFQPQLLKFLDRDHTAKDIHHVMLDAKAAGFENYSCDLIFAIPEQTTADLKNDIMTALSFKPKHISAYQLTFEVGTPLTKSYKCANLNLPAKLSEEDSLEQFILVEQLLESGGLSRYEISNFSKPGFESKHNLNYWSYGEYLGLGSGAVSFLYQPQRDLDSQDNVFGKRWTTTRNVAHYLKSDFSEKSPDKITLKTAMAEFCFLGLRKTAGFSLQSFEQQFARKFGDVYSEIIKELTAQGLLIMQEDRVTLSKQGLLLSDAIFRKFV